MSEAARVTATTQGDRIAIAAGEIHVWWASLTELAPEEPFLRAALAPDELDRAARFHFDHHRRRFVLARGALRALLGRYLDVEARAVAFSYGSYGKPALLPRRNDPHLEFSVSHAVDVAVYAISAGRELGVDVEAIGVEMDHLAVAQRIFTADELATLAALSPERRPAYFFACWTRKEALTKAHGGGLALELGGIEAGGAHHAVTSVLGRRYRLLELTPWPGFAASCAVVGEEPPHRLQEGRLLPAEGRG